MSRWHLHPILRPARKAQKPAADRRTGISKGKIPATPASRTARWAGCQATAPTGQHRRWRTNRRKSPATDRRFADRFLRDRAVPLAPEASASANRIAPEVRKSSARHVRHCPRPVRTLQDEPIPTDPAPTQIRDGWARKTAMQDARTSWPRTIRDMAGAVNIAEARMEYTLTIDPLAKPGSLCDQASGWADIGIGTAKNMPSTRRRS